VAETHNYRKKSSN